MEARFMKQCENAVVSICSSYAVAEYNLCAAIGNEKKYVAIAHEDAMKVHIGIAMVIPNEYFGAASARSDLEAKHDPRPANCVDVINSDYRGETIVSPHNGSCLAQVLMDGDWITQIILVGFTKAMFYEVRKLDLTDRCENGFGSTRR